MRGDYPFVIPVTIICGAGGQVLSESEVVEQWIRDNERAPPDLNPSLPLNQPDVDSSSKFQRVPSLDCDGSQCVPSLHPPPRSWQS
eukprot:scaffold905_cov135-Skeletonema_marinoi.AAC.1